MAALSADRNTPSRPASLREPPAAAAVKFYAGAIAMVNAAGNATPGATATSCRGIGRVARQVDNSGGSAGDVNVQVETGVFRYGNSASTDTIGRGDIGADCYIVDDQTVAKTNGSNTRSVAGKVFDVDALGVWVLFS